MRELSLDERYVHLVDAFRNIGTFLLRESTEEIDFRVFEEFDGDCVSFLHPNTLSALCRNHLISEEVVHLSLDLADRFRNMEQTSRWDAASVRTDSAWLKILMIADNIREALGISNDSETQKETR